MQDLFFVVTLMQFQNYSAKAEKVDKSSIDWTKTFGNAFPVLKYASNEIRTTVTQFLVFFLAQPTYKSKDGKNVWSKFALDCWTAATAFGTQI